jgi:hypothetical protein
MLAAESTGATGFGAPGLLELLTNDRVTGVGNRPRNAVA